MGIPQPVLDLVGPRDIVDVHADLVADVGWQSGGCGIDGGLEDHRCPKLLILLVCWGEWSWQVGLALTGREA